jgi:hypothetical protein
MRIREEFQITPTHGEFSKNLKLLHEVRQFAAGPVPDQEDQ